MKRVFVPLVAVAAPLVLGGSALAYHGQPGGHLPPVQENIDLVSRLQLTCAAPDRFSEIAVLGNHAYVGRWPERQLADRDHGGRLPGRHQMNSAASGN